MTTDWRGYVPKPERIVRPLGCACARYEYCAACVPSAFEREHRRVPNRLYGAYIKPDGDAA